MFEQISGVPQILSAYEEATQSEGLYSYGRVTEMIRFFSHAARVENNMKRREVERQTVGALFSSIFFL